MQRRFAGISLPTLAYVMCVGSIAATRAEAQQVIVIPAGTTDTNPKTVGGTDSITVARDGALSTSVSPSINWSTSSTDLRITNSGTIRSIASDGRAIDTSGGNNQRTITLVNNVGAIIESANDAFRINIAPTAGTIRVDNFGTIRATNGGQALDFAAVTGGAGIVINNYVGGELRANGQDGIRPGARSIVSNAGLILSDGAPNNDYDGIDWQTTAGVVSLVNQTTGVISGLRHGVIGETSNIAVNASNAGTITGRNGTGVRSEGNGSILNTGTITGQWDGVATNADGDGVRFNFSGTITNSGVIQGLSARGVDASGRPNSAQGVATGGGTIVNNAGATIFGADTGILVTPGFSAMFPFPMATPTTITNAGTIRGVTGRAITLDGPTPDTTQTPESSRAGWRVQSTWAAATTRSTSRAARSSQARSMAVPGPTSSA